MPNISLTEFIDFALTLGVAKVNKVKAAKNQKPYNPAEDHYRQLRALLVDYHCEKVNTISFAESGAHSKKERTYQLAIKGYKKFLGKTHYEWFKPHKAKWTHLSLNVSVNPEIGLVIDGRKHLIKLYLKEEKLSKNRIAVALGMMSVVFPAKSYDVAVLDTVRGRLYTGEGKDAQLIALLEGEAATFLAIWESLPPSP